MLKKIQTTSAIENEFTIQKITVHLYIDRWCAKRNGGRIEFFKVRDIKGNTLDSTFHAEYQIIPGGEYLEELNKGSK